MYSVCNTLKGWVSPFGNLRIKACLLAPRSLSQATTSFIACNRQGIHHVHLFACPYNVSLSLLAQRKKRYGDKKVQRCQIQLLESCLLIIQSLPMTGIPAGQIKLYFFQIVKERNSQ